MKDRPLIVKFYNENIKQNLKIKYFVFLIKKKKKKNYNKKKIINQK